MNEALKLGETDTAARGPSMAGMGEASEKKTSESAIAGWLITAWFVWLVAVLSTLGSLYVVFHGDPEPWDWGSPVVRTIAMWTVLATLFAWLSYLAPSFFFRRRGKGILKYTSAYYFMHFIIAMFLAEMVCVMGQVCAFTGLPPGAVAAVFFVGTWCLFIFHFPTERKIRAWSDDSSVAGGGEPTETLDATGGEITATGVLEESAQVLRKRGVALFGATGAWLLPAAVVYFFWMRWLSGLETIGPIQENSGTIVWIPFSAAALGAGVSLAAGALAGRKVGFMESMTDASRRLVPLIVAFAVVRLATWVGGWLLVVPGVLLAIRFALTVPVLMLEERGPLEALKVSWARTREYQLTIFYAFVPVGLVLVVTALVRMVLWTNVVAPPASNSWVGVSVTATAVLCALTWGAATLATVLLAAVESVVYLQVREGAR
jgi:hypothetical protein